MSILPYLYLKNWKILYLDCYELEFAVVLAGSELHWEFIYMNTDASWSVFGYVIT